MRLKKRRGFLFFIVILALVILNGKAIGRFFYPLRYNDQIERYAKQYDLDPYLVASVIKVESNFEKDAVSIKDARGLMQLTPSTSKWVAEKIDITNFDVNMLYTTDINIRMGCWYLNDLRKEFGTNMKVVLAAYNGGRGNVKKWLKNKENSKDGVNLHYIPFKETDQYVKRVEVYYNLYKLLYTNDKSYIQTMKRIIYEFF
jgi:soluble lytic murein transglycosylase